MALVAARLEQFQQLLETRVILGTGHYLCRGWEKIRSQGYFKLAKRRLLLFFSGTNMRRGHMIQQDS